MTKFCTITTKHDLDFLDENEMSFFLTEQLEQKEYQDYILNHPGMKYILDCDAFEWFVLRGKTEPVPFHKTIDLAKRFNATFVVLPDYMCEAEKTFESAKEHFAETKEVSEPLVAIQGKSKEEITWLTNKLYDLGVRSFAIPLNAPKFEEEECRKLRLKRYSYFKEALAGREINYLHFLGLTQDVMELYKTPKEVNSLDSGKPIQTARAGIKYSKGCYISNSVHIDNEFDIKLTSEQRQLAKENIQFIRNILANIE